jgi:hypothetical protein
VGKGDRCDALTERQAERAYRARDFGIDFLKPHDPLRDSASMPRVQNVLCASSATRVGLGRNRDDHWATESSVSTGDLLCPLYVDTSRPECANTGHSAMALLTELK